MDLIRKKGSSNLLHLFLIICLSRILLDYIYITDVSPHYTYLGLTCSFSESRMILSWAVLLVFIVLIIHVINKDDNNEKKGAAILSILLCVSAVPSTTVIAYFNISPLFSIMLCIYWIITVIAYEASVLKQKKIFSLDRTGSLFYFITAIFVLNIIIIIIRYTGLNISFDLSDVYEARTIFKQNQIPTILRYLFFGSTMVFPIVVVYALKTKKRKLAAVAAACQLLAFFSDGRKSTLFMLILTIIGYYFVKNFSIKLIPVGSFGIILLGFAEKLFCHSNNIINYIIRRLYLIPAYLNYAYYDYFSGSPKDMLRQSIMGRLGFESPYTQPIPEAVGTQYYGGSYCNNGLFSDAFANFGFIGVIVFPIILALAFKWLDRCSENLSLGASLGIIISMSVAFLSSFFFTVMLTHGFIISCIVVYAMPIPNNGNKNEGL